MPIIREEVKSSTETEQKLNFNKAKLKVIKHHNTVTAKKETANLLRSEVALDTTLHKIGQDKNAKISKMAESMAKMTEATLLKIEQNECAKISKMAESMAKMTEATLLKIEQNECAKISKMIEHMHKMTEINIDELQQIPDNSEIDLKQTKVAEKSNQPWFQ
jgi:hypothetical protein